MDMLSEADIRTLTTAAPSSSPPELGLAEFEGSTKANRAEETVTSA